MSGSEHIGEVSVNSVASGWTPVPDTLIKKFDTLTALVWGRIWRYGRKKGYSFASLQTIARELGVSRETVKRRTKNLLADEYIEDVRDHPGKRIGTVRYFQTTKKLTLKIRIGMNEETKVTKPRVHLYEGQREPGEVQREPQRENLINKEEEERNSLSPSLILEKLLNISPHVSSPQNIGAIEATKRLAEAGATEAHIDAAKLSGYWMYEDPHPSQIADWTLRYLEFERRSPAEKLGVQVYAGPDVE